jgi:RNA polymerase sigma factor FliA
MYTQTGRFDRETAITTYAPLVKRIAHHLIAKLPPSVQIDDIVQAGMMGLMDAAGRYETNHGTQFETYAAQRIKGAMLDELRQNDWMPRSVRGAQRRIESAVTRLEQRLSRPATESEMAIELKMSLAEYHELLNEARGCQLIYLDELGGYDGDEQYLDRHVTEEIRDPLKQIEDKRFRTALVAAIEQLPEREKMVMGLYYEQDLNLREIAEVLGVTESRVCQIHSQAVSRLRTKLKGWIGKSN